MAYVLLYTYSHKSTVAGRPPEVTHTHTPLILGRSIIQVAHSPKGYESGKDKQQDQIQQIPRKMMVRPIRKVRLDPFIRTSIAGNIRVWTLQEFKELGTNRRLDLGCVSVVLADNKAFEEVVTIQYMKTLLLRFPDKCRLDTRTQLRMTYPGITQYIQLEGKERRNDIRTPVV